jgi:hypothetical protein
MLEGGRLGRLGRLPIEIQYMVLRWVDIPCLLGFRQVSSDASHVVDTLSDYAKVGDRRSRHDLAEAKSVIELIRTTQISVAIRDWLLAPDVSVNHNAARTKRHSGTGMWFIQGPHFSRCITQPSAFLWLLGFAGSGKTVLCSTAVEHAYRQRGRKSHVGAHLVLTHR